MQNCTYIVDDRNAAPRLAFPLVLMFLIVVMAFVGSSMSEALNSISRDFPTSASPAE